MTGDGAPVPGRHPTAGGSRFRRALAPCRVERTGRIAGADRADRADGNCVSDAPARTLRQRLGDDRGQAAVEFTGTIPIILITIVLMWQAALTGYTFALAGNAADEAVRAGVVGGDGACQAAGQAHLPAAWQGPGFSCGESGEHYRATVALDVPLLFPGVSFSVTVRGEAAAPREDAP
ncbi:TadE family protein [Streptomyces sp. NPDC005963]|uniref:TadE/TadG family type IV pilus assembly protein n=1 Tax=Streptomyces sp. NPDC005963 TaxID=3156721 RepID=UPI0033F10D54